MNKTRPTKKRTTRFPRKNNTAFSGKRGHTKKKKNESTLDPNSLVMEASDGLSNSYQPSRTFNEMPLHAKLKSNIDRMGFTLPTQIQEESLEQLKAEHDLVGVANTGTGKTGAFLIPIIDQLLNEPKSAQSLVIVPTRELAKQVEDEFKSLAKDTDIYVSSFIGGTSVGRDIKKLKKHNDLLIGTPGRLLDLANRGFLKLENIANLVLDEFDRMLDMGFVNDIKQMVRTMHNRKQTMLFSATIDHTQQSLINELLNNPAEVKVSKSSLASGQIEQDIIRVPQDGDKFSMLVDLLNGAGFDKVLIFVETKRLVDKVSKKLRQSGIKADLIHGDKTQSYRTNALDKFKKGKVQVLVATDVAARGIDVTDISHVINYQLPINYESYLHRIGRTGRAGKSGKAFTFVD